MDTDDSNTNSPDSTLKRGGLIIDENERIYVIIAVVVGLLVLQVIGCIICYKERWLAKRKMKRNQQSSNTEPSNNPIEITEVLTTSREPKKKRVRPQEEISGSETNELFLPEQQMEEVAQPETSTVNMSSEKKSVVQIHETAT